MQYDRDSDPRTWDRQRRADCLRELGLPLVSTEDGSEVSKYRGVYVHWTTTLDTRITLVIDEILIRHKHLAEAWAHKGGCGLVWDGDPPIHYISGEGLEVLNARGEPQDWWVIDESRNLDKNIAALRELAYSDYLKTDHWLAMRKRALDHYGKTCVLCNSDERIEVHHRTYERIGDEFVTDLIVLCRACHATFHGKAA